MEGTSGISYSMTRARYSVDTNLKEESHSVPRRIHISKAKRFARENGCRQVIIAAWDGERTHIVTYGISLEDCAQAAEGGNRIKEALGWPKDLKAEPSRVRQLQECIMAQKLELDQTLEQLRVLESSTRKETP